jgi:probable HAF family extracellular repeat protein
MNRFSRNRCALFITFVLLLLMSCGGDSRPPQEPPLTPPIDEPPSPPVEDPPVTPVEPPFTPTQIPLFAFTDLGVLEGYANGNANGVNDRGQVVGSVWRRAGDLSLPSEEAFLWEDGQMRGLGVLEPWGEYSRAAAINNLGQVVGEGDNPSFHSASFWEEEGILRDLYLNQGNESAAFDVNDLGQVVGFNFKRLHPQAYTWENGLEIELGEEYGESYAYAINNAGQVVGKRLPVTGTTEDGFPIWGDPNAFLWENDIVRDLGIIGAASDINAGGQIVGSVFEQGPNVTHAFLWHDEATTELGHLGGGWSTAEAINDTGQVVGASREQPYDPEDPEPIKYFATLWERDRIRDLNQLADTGGAHLQWAYDINNRGQIVGRALTGDSEHGFLLTPQWDGVITRESSYSTTTEMGERLIFDYWADMLPDSDPASPFTIEVMVMDAFGLWSLLGQVEEETASASWKTAFVQVPANLIGTNRELSLQLSDDDAAADPIIFVKSFRSQP